MPKKDTLPRFHYTRSTHKSWFSHLIQRGVAVKNRWAAGEPLYIYFVNGEQWKIDEFKKWVLELKKIANLNPVFVNDPNESYCRVAFNEGQGSWSFVGKDNLNVGVEYVTLNLGWHTKDYSAKERKRVVVHEFLHFLGIPHEHQHPEDPFEYNRENVIEDMIAQGWDLHSIEHNIFHVHEKSKHDYTEGRDEYSIMHYYIPARWAANGVASPVNYVLSDGDKEWLKELFPMDEKPQECDARYRAAIKDIYKDYYTAKKLRKSTHFAVAQILGIHSEGSKKVLVNRLIEQLKDK